MLFVVAALVALAGGAHAQCLAPNNVTYQFCGSVFAGEFNLYWNYGNDTNMLQLLWDAPTTGWHAFGFSDIDAPAGERMPGATVFPGCIDLFDNTTPGTGVFRITARSVAGLMPNATTPWLGVDELSRGVVGNTCWVRFQRPFDGGEATTPRAQVISDATQLVVGAYGDDVLDNHGVTRRGVATINFANGTGVDPVADRDLIGDDDGAASALSMSALVPALAAAVAALWQ